MRTPGNGAIDLHHLGPAIRLLRRHRRLKQYEMARRAGITKAMASRYELGRGVPSVRNLVAMLHALRADFAHLQQAMRLTSTAAARRDPRQS